MQRKFYIFMNLVLPMIIMVAFAGVLGWRSLSPQMKFGEHETASRIFLGVCSIVSIPLFTLLLRKDYEVNHKKILARMT